ncbi:glucoamylase [Phragmitibacter flavus]|uniref:Glucoamylase n=1 Tax=Phragmitibacter flavus TaxID=2576071 RepID=A0A5R8KAQ9_9BACT|nr:glycoside hydrolase family 15 protein [Phragmitibacter flavus]TLD69400.1 glucoamylase [Phragmitibacter flavus]
MSDDAHCLAAPGAPGLEPRWTSSSKVGVGTAYHTSCRVWFTLSHGIVNEIYWPTIDTPQVRDFGFLITDGESFVHEEKRDLLHEVEYPEKDCLFYRLTNSDKDGRYRLVKEVLADPHRSVVLVKSRLEVLDEALKGKLRVFALMAPHLEGRGKGNSAWVCDFAGRRLLRAERGRTFLALGCDRDFVKRSAGFVGVSDGWQDVMQHRGMEWEYGKAENGNVALTGEIDLSEGLEWTCGISLSASGVHAATCLLQSLAVPFEEKRVEYCQQWRRAEADEKDDLSGHTGDGGSMARLSRCVLLAHEDKVFAGAIIASLSIPWGDDRGDGEIGGYHLVWTRDLVQSASALLASGQLATPRHALIWLSCIQQEDGSFPQNSWMDGRPYWKGVQLDESAAPALLAWRLWRAGGMKDFNPMTVLTRSARFLMLQGPVTHQERWEEQSGYSPSTLAVVIAGLVCTAEFAGMAGDEEGAEFLLAYADWLNGHVDEWCACGEKDGRKAHYLRITPSSSVRPDAHPDPDSLEIQLANGGGKHLAREVVGGDFLHLVRLGLRAADEPLVLSSIEVMDEMIRHELPQGPGWRRYNFDGYGQRDDGEGFDEVGVGRCWPILTGERGHYELAAGRDPLPFIETMEKMANEGGMISEQLWDGEDQPGHGFKKGEPTGAAMPLCWSHAEYLSLVRSRRDGVVFDRIPACYERYVKLRTGYEMEMWTMNHRTRWVGYGKGLRLVLGEAAVVKVWGLGASEEEVLELEARGVETLNVWFVDVATEGLAAGARVRFEVGGEKGEVEVKR